MPEKKPKERASQRAREGKAPSTQAGEFVREEIEHLRTGKHGAQSTEQAIAIGLSKARRSGVKLPLPERGKASQRARRQAKRDLAKGKRGASKAPSRRRSRAATKAGKRESRAPGSRRALAKHARKAARRRSPASRSTAARKAARTRQRKKT